MHLVSGWLIGDQWLVVGWLVGRWSVVVGRWLVHLVGGRLVGGCWPVVGWSVGRWSVVGSRLVGCFKETPNINGMRDVRKLGEKYKTFKFILA